MKRFPLILCLLLFVLGGVKSQDVTFLSGDLQISINDRGYFSSVKVDGRDLLCSGTYPIIAACHEEHLIFPQSCVLSDSVLSLDMSDGNQVLLKMSASQLCLTMKVVGVPAGYDALLLAPVAVNIDEVVGDVIGVVQGKGLAFGIQGLNEKVVAGFPQQYAAVITEQFEYQENINNPSITSLAQATTNLQKGTMLQFSAWRRNEVIHRKVEGVERVMVMPVDGEGAMIEGAGIALFGCRQTGLLQRIGAIEVEQGLPHPFIKGEWNKCSKALAKSYFIAEFTEKDIDFLLEICQKAGLEYLVHPNPFSNWGHYQWHPAFAKGGDASVRQMVEKTESQGVHLGLHAFSNLLTTNDIYVAPSPNEHLLKQGTLQLLGDLSMDETDFCVRRSPLFDKNLSINVLQIGNELITYRTCESAGNLTYLHHCKRGAFGTKKSAHGEKATVYKLWDHPSKALFSDFSLQDELSQRLVQLVNNTGLSHFFFDHIDGCAYSGHGDYAMARFAAQCFSGWDHDVMNEAGRLTHFSWHVHSRMNRDELWESNTRVRQVEAYLKDQDFFDRNLLPRMLGILPVRTADKNFESTSLEEVEWFLSKAAGFDAGFGITADLAVLKNHGQMDRLLGTIRNWERLRLAGAFSEEQKKQMSDPYAEWHLESLNDSTFSLYPLSISRRYFVNVSKVGAINEEWQWRGTSDGHFALRLYVKGKGEVTNPSLATSSGTVTFSCTVKNNQYLMLDFDGKAYIADQNFNWIQVVDYEGEALFPEGLSNVFFSASTDPKSTVSAQITLRYYTREQPSTVVMK